MKHIIEAWLKPMSLGAFGALSFTFIFMLWVDKESQAILFFSRPPELYIYFMLWIDKL